VTGSLKRNVRISLIRYRNLYH